MNNLFIISVITHVVCQNRSMHTAIYIFFASILDKE